jgi:adenylate cyclase
MATEDFKRKLAAILSADVKDYSRLMGEDEEATVRTITAHRKVITSVIQKYRGRVVDSPGDNILAEFVSVVDAVQSGVEIQEVVRAKNAELPEERRMEFRIGINLGDVIQEGERIYGDGVNIAARIEGLAEGGGICISGSAYEQIENKLALGYEYIGEHAVKNIVKPIRVYKVPIGPETLHKVTDERRPEPKRAQRAILAVVIALLLVIGGVALLKSYLRTTSPPVEVAFVEKMAFPLPDKPSIAVLPFDNMSGDPEQEYFSDGITEQIITGLSKISSLFVIARNSTFAYKGKPVKVQRVSEELGVRYILEGSVQKSGDRVRINAQLIDAIKGNHLWSETYDRELKDIFAVQDDITQKILTALQVELTHGEQARVWSRGTNNLKAYLKHLQAREKWLQMNKESNALARKLAEETIALDPDYAVAYLSLAATHILDVFLGSSKSPKDSMKQAIALNKKALALDDSFAQAHSQLGILYTMTRQHDKGVAEAERGVELDPNSAVAHDLLGMTLNYAGRPEEAIPMLKKAIRLEPLAPGKYYYHLGQAYLFTGQCDEAIAACEEALRRASNNLFAHVNVTAAYSICGREEEARAAAAGVLRIDPNFSCDYHAKKSLPYKNQADIDRYVAALRKAGLPE